MKSTLLRAAHGEDGRDGSIADPFNKKIDLRQRPERPFNMRWRRVLDWKIGMCRLGTKPGLRGIT